MTTFNKKVLVLGATGQQGGAAAAQLLAAGWQVRVFTRNPTSKEAQALADLGAEICPGDMTDRTALDTAMEGVYGVFSLQLSGWDLTNNREEIRIGKQVADAAKEAGVRHFVYSSHGGAEEQARFREVAKWEVEKHIRALDLPATMLRLPFFMENYIHFRLYGIQSGTYVEATKPDVPINMIAVDDIGVFVKLAFGRPEQFLGKAIELAGDALTPPAITAAISRATGRQIAYAQLPMETVRGQSEILGRIYDWINGGGYQVDISALRKLHPELMTFDAWLEKKGRTQLEALFEGHAALE